jgi:hypothetical protein
MCTRVYQSRDLLTLDARTLRDFVTTHYYSLSTTTTTEWGRQQHRWQDNNNNDSRTTTKDGRWRQDMSNDVSWCFGYVFFCSFSFVFLLLTILFRYSMTTTIAGLRQRTGGDAGTRRTTCPGVLVCSPIVSPLLTTLFRYSMTTTIAGLRQRTGGDARTRRTTCPGVLVCSFYSCLFVFLITNYSI